MYLTMKQQLKKLTSDEYKNIANLSHIAKNLTNEAIFNARQHYFETKKYLSYVENYKLLKNSINYKMLNSNMAQKIIKEVDIMFKSFYGLLKAKNKGNYNGKINIPKYLPKSSHQTLIIGFVRIKDGKLILPYSNMYKKKHSKVEIKIPPKLYDKKIKEIRIIPKNNAKFFEVQYIYQTEIKDMKLDKKNVLAIDLGINNLMTCVTNQGKTFIIDGRKLKSINQWFNKENARLQSIKDKQKILIKYTNRQHRKLTKRNNRVNDYISKSVRLVINYCLENNIGTLVCGYNKDIQKNSNMGNKNNQTFINIPYGKIRSKLEYLCKLYNIKYIEQEESYTSVASFLDRDIIPVYKSNDVRNYVFSGKRVKRGLYQSKEGYLINADVNGAFNILVKSKVVAIDNSLYNRGELNTPIRIRVS